MEKISVAIPGPWWTNLTYLSPKSCPGARVRVPVGKGSRVGLVIDGDGGHDYNGELREIVEIIDHEPILPAFFMPLIRWFMDTYLCGAGTAMKTLLPASFLRGEGLYEDKTHDAVLNHEEDRSPLTSSEDSFVYEPIDSIRWERYAEILSDGRPSLVCFPIYDAAKDFARFMGNGVTLYPRSGAKAEWRAWSALLTSGDGVIIGGQTSAAAPIRNLARIIIEDECNNAWRTIRLPVFNVRSFLAKRARIEGVQLVLGGRLPSSRVYMTLERTSRVVSRSIPLYRSGKKNFLFVDSKLAYAPSVKGVQDALAVSEPLVRETEAAIGRGSWALWILDRKGYAGEVICDECGNSLRCARCGGALRWEASKDRLVCVACGASERIPQSCPTCGGRLLMARRPGLEALLPLARSAIMSQVPVVSLTDERAPSLEVALKSKSGLAIGTRAALSLCDRVDIGMVGWIDADGEARSQEYDSRARAFGLVWESRWRGTAESSGKRLILLQTRRPSRDWQRGFENDGPNKPGWEIFWRGELRERREFSMPPFVSLIKIEANPQDISAMMEKFDDAHLEYWLADSPEGTIWLRTNNLSSLRSALAPFFSIKRVSRVKGGYPTITINHE